MLRVCAVVLISATALWLPSPAAACKCAQPEPVGDAVRAAAAVFEGRVKKLTPLGSSDLVVELSVVRTWKGADSEHILLRTRQAAAACGFPFVPNESYLIFARQGPAEANLPGLEVLRCGRTKLMTEAEADLAQLGMGVVPVTAHGSDLPPGSEPASSQPLAHQDGVATQRARPAAGGCASCNSLGGLSATQNSHDARAICLLALAAVWSVVRRRRSVNA